MEINTYFDEALKLVGEASKIAKEGFYSIKKVDTKMGPWDTVTEYDTKVENFLITNLSAKFPTHKFMGEETSNERSLGTDPTWIIDPIDGTNNFAVAYPESAISIGLAIDREVVLGIVANPIREEVFSAVKGKGAFLNGKPIHASKETDIQKALVGYEVSLARVDKIRPKLMARLDGIVSQARGIRCVGCASLGMCYVAAGVWDAYTADYLAPWDYAGGAIIVQEANGIILGTNGAKFDVMDGKMLVAGTNELAQDIIQRIKAADDSLTK